MRGRLLSTRLSGRGCKFQSTPPCGGDHAGMYIGNDQVHFNPRPLAGATPGTISRSAVPSISIHAPLRGRRDTMPMSISTEYFNPRPLAGATIFSPLSAPPGIFQSTPPCGGDPSAASGSATAAAFQSTPPCGGDKRSKHFGYLCKISIHAPLRGRHPHWIMSVALVVISIHAPLRGRRFVVLTWGWTTTFQSTPPCGGDVVVGAGGSGGTDFNPRPLAGAT